MDIDEYDCATKGYLIRVEFEMDLPKVKKRNLNMRLLKFVKTLSLTIAILPCLAVAQDASSSAKELSRASCEKTWMAKADDSPDEVTFRDFGQKYCDCTASQPLGLNAESTKTQAICMSRVALYLTMDNIGADEGLSNLTEAKIKTSCTAIWDIVSPNVDTTNKEKNSNLCSCAAPKLNTLAKDKENYTDREWYAKINEITAGC